MGQNILGGKILNLTFWAFFYHFGPNMLISAYFFQTLVWMFLIFAIETYFLVFSKMPEFFSAESAHFLGRICSFRPISSKRYYKSSSFSPWKHIFWSYLKKWRKNFGWENSQIWLLGVFHQNFTILGQICSFRPIFPKHYFKCSSFWP